MQIWRLPASADLLGQPDQNALGAPRCVVDVPTREEALKWAAKTADACRCAQEVREFMPDPAVGN